MILLIFFLFVLLFLFVRGVMRGLFAAVAVVLPAASCCGLTDVFRWERTDFPSEMAEKRKKQQTGEQEEKTASFTSSLGKNLGKVGNAFKSGYRSIPKQTHKFNPKTTAAGMVKGVAGAAAGIGASIAADTLFNKYRQYQDKKDREDEQRRIRTQQQVALHRKLNN